jgi:hypothetical protein
MLLGTVAPSVFATPLLKPMQRRGINALVDEVLPQPFKGARALKLQIGRQALFGG